MLNPEDPHPNYQNIPEPFPPKWAIAYGQDRYGFWADLQVEQLLQRLRYIPAGTFLMGSPETEIDRDSNEMQHEVTLSQGYWMADTACTQALWQVVMWDNPSSFQKDIQNPVEQVSWNDVQYSLTKLNQLIAELNAVLPSEAQWEYACRAGTSTPFSFGENITPEQVNYDGNYPYAKGQKGKYREKTVRVKALAKNQWGLYQMHCNVWEWCQDWYGDYDVEPVQDPQGKEQDERRVLRGGSWFDSGLHVRSAYRNRYTPARRDYFIGFRFSLVQASSEAVAESNRSNEKTSDQSEVRAEPQRNAGAGLQSRE